MTSYCYAVLFNDTVGTREAIQEFLDSRDDVTFWHSCLPHCVFCTSTLQAGELSEAIGAHFGKDTGHRFLVLDTDTDRQGWLTKQAWHMMRNPTNPRLPK